MTRPTRTRGIRAASLACAATLALAACTTPSSSPPTVAASPPSSALPSTAAHSSGAPSASASRRAAGRSSRPKSASPARTASTVVRQQSTCTSIRVLVIRGGAAQGNEFAALQFTNTGSSPCQLVGFPHAQLYRHGAPTGRPATPQSSQSTVYSLRPHATAESRLLDFSDCQAPLADHVRVGVPGTDIHSTQPVVLRACKITVGPLGAAS